jgi:hypothetical protein
MILLSSSLIQVMTKCVWESATFPFGIIAILADPAHCQFLSRYRDHLDFGYG